MAAHHEQAVCDLVATDVTDPLLTMQTAVPLLLH